MIAATSARVPGGRVSEAFDLQAPSYDDRWSRSAIGSVQRTAVWKLLDRAFLSGECVLDLGCGTGVDAVRLARNGVRVHGIDLSAEMIRTALERVRREKLDNLVTLERRAMEELPGIEGRFDGALSNFGALNCVKELRPVANHLSRLVRPGGRLVLCIMGQFCLWESVWYLTHGRAAKAFRRRNGRSGAVRTSLGAGPDFEIRYPSIRDLIESFNPEFSLNSITGVGVLVPPACMESAARSYPRVVGALAGADRLVSGWPVLRGLGDHRLLEFVRR